MKVLLIQLAVLESEFLPQVLRIPDGAQIHRCFSFFSLSNARNLSRRAHIASFDNVLVSCQLTSTSLRYLATEGSHWFMSFFKFYHCRTRQKDLLQLY
jgi:hypothetical protein